MVSVFVFAGKEFADKELRVLMSQNGMMINDVDPATGRYMEKTKASKILSILSVVDTLISPGDFCRHVPPLPVALCSCHGHNTRAVLRRCPPRARAGQQWAGGCRRCGASGQYGPNKRASGSPADER